MPRAVIAALALLVLPAAAAADPPAAPRCAPTDLLPEAVPANPFPRTRALIVDSGLLLDGNAGAHAAWAVGLEYDFVLDRAQRFKLGPRFGALFGSGGDVAHGPVSLDPGLRFRGSFYVAPVFDAYVVGKVSVPLALGPTVLPGLRVGAGLGLRLAEAVHLELTADAGFAIEHDYAQGGQTSTAFPGFGASIGFDTCIVGSWCAPRVTPQVTEDETPLLYADALAVCQSTRGSPLRAQLCAAVDGAIDASDHAPGTDDDAALAFLEGARRKIADGGLKARFAALVEHHRALARCRTENQTAARVAAQRERTLKVAVRYAPYPIVLRRILGCAVEVPRAAGAEECAVPRD